MPELVPKPGAVKDVVDQSTEAVSALGVSARSRQILFRSWVRDASRIRSAMNVVAAHTVNEITVDDFVIDGTRLRSKSLRRLSGILNNSMDETFALVDSSIHDSVETTVTRSMNRQHAYLKASGLNPMNQNQINGIRTSTLDKLGQEFPPGSGVNYYDRLNKIRVQHKIQLQKVLRKSYEPKQAMRGIIKDLKTGIAYSRLGRTPIAGGSASKKLQRLLAGEEARLTNQIELKVMQEMGVFLAYWRLSPAHRFYGGNEICELHSEGTGPGVRQRLLNLGLSETSVRGLYLVESYPDYPHPHCICYPDPLLLSNKLALK